MHYRAKLERLGKWRAVFAGWQLGTRPKGDPECDAVRDHREVTMMLRAEVNTLTRLCVEAGVFSPDAFTAELGDEADRLNDDYAAKFPGVEATEHGIAIVDVAKAAQTMAGWRP